MLYFIATPIGNINDISLRQAETLLSVDVLLAEDTRSADKLLNLVAERLNLTRNPKQIIISFYKEVEFEKVPSIIERLKNEETIGVISDAGMPLLSDPGYLLLKTVIKYQLPYAVIPGPTAITTALLHSGFNPQQFFFAGFLPKKKGAIQKEVQRWIALKTLIPETIIVFFESPHRIHDTLSILTELLPNNRLAICRELTKHYEEILRGTPAELLAKEFKGELTIVLE